MWCCTTGFYGVIVVQVLATQACILCQGLKLQCPKQHYAFVISFWLPACHIYWTFFHCIQLKKTNNTENPWRKISSISASESAASNPHQILVFRWMSFEWLVIGLWRLFSWVTLLLWDQTNRASLGPPWPCRPVHWLPFFGPLLICTSTYHKHPIRPIVLEILWPSRLASQFGPCSRHSDPYSCPFFQLVIHQLQDCSLAALYILLINLP